MPLATGVVPIVVFLAYCLSLSEMKFQHWLCLFAAAITALAPVVASEHLPMKVEGVIAALVTVSALILKSPLAETTTTETP